MSDVPPYGVLAEFDVPEALIAAGRAAAAAGYEAIDAFTPFPVEGLDEALGHKPPRMRYLALGGGIAGAVIAYGMQLWSVWSYPIDIGGRALAPPQSFGLITFELTVLGAVLAMIVGLFLLCRLPKLHHPLFASEPFERATLNGFFLLIPIAGTGNNRVAAEAFLLARDPRSISAVRP